MEIKMEEEYDLMEKRMHRSCLGGRKSEKHSGRNSSRTGRVDNLSLNINKDLIYTAQCLQKELLTGGGSERGSISIPGTAHSDQPQFHIPPLLTPGSSNNRNPHRIPLPLLAFSERDRSDRNRSDRLMEYINSTNRTYRATTTNESYSTIEDDAFDSG